MRLPALAAAPLALGLTLATSVAVAPSASAAHDGTVHTTTTTTTDVPVATSANVDLIANIPETTAISMEFSPSAPFAYVSSLDTISVLDLADPRAPKLRGTLVNALFENEAMTYGERTVGGVTTRFVLAGIDLYQASPSDPTHVNADDGPEVLVVDVTDPDDPRPRGRVKATTSTHTVQCVTQKDCRYAYTAGNRGGYSVLDLSDLDAPREVVAKAPSPAAGPNPVFTRGAGHYWDFVTSGTRRIGWHTGSGGAAAFDVTDPVNPTLVTTTGAAGKETPLNDFILHNSMHPNATAFRPDAPPSIENGNLLVVTEEDYANEGDEIACDRAGSTQTWWIKRLDGTPDAVVPLDHKTISDFGGGLTTPAAAFCSAHWFDVHQAGFVAQGFYGAGLRILDVADPANITQFGYATLGATEVWDAYWVPSYNKNGQAQSKKTNVVYTADAVRGIDVYEVALPARKDVVASDGYGLPLSGDVTTDGSFFG
ncbi:MAG: hypothetical protein M3P93_16355 [Actinomycetota bacterium]|nr:hypothetical protein [Actinomycetota bacterium]